MEGSPGVWDQIVTTLLGQGVSGVANIVLGYAVWRLYNRNQELHETLYENGKESVKAHEASASALNRLSDLLLRGRPPSE